MDYASVYSHFRIKKCIVTLSRDRGSGDGAGLLDNYLIVGSRPFAALVAPQALSDQNRPPSTSIQPGIANSVPDFRNSTLVPSQTEEALRQTRWQRVVTPNSTRPYIRLGFYPYTLIGTFGPSMSIPANPPTVDANPTVNAIAYQRVWESRKWMPFTWAGGSGAFAPITFFGPFMVTEAATPTAEGEINAAITVNVTLTAYLQFKGQK